MRANIERATLAYITSAYIKKNVQGKRVKSSIPFTLFLIPHYVIPKTRQSRLTLRSYVVFVITSAYIKKNVQGKRVKSSIPFTLFLIPHYVIPKRTQSRLTLRSCVVFVITSSYIKNNHILADFADYKHNK